MSGFVGKTFFGKIGGDGLPGAFYDLKQNPERQPIEYNVNNYAAIIANAASRKFAPTTMKEFYKASQQVRNGPPLRRLKFLPVNRCKTCDEGERAHDVTAARPALLGREEQQVLEREV